MKYSDSFVPRWRNSDQTVRMRAVKRIKDMTLLQQIADKDKDPTVCKAARYRLEDIQVRRTLSE